jgi:AcrR family transcriptional regulator
MNLNLTHWQPKENQGSILFMTKHAAAVVAKKRDRDDTESRLLKAALDVFSKLGFDAATTRNIAKKAGVNESLIHRYFESKLGLFLALKKQFRDNLIQRYLSYEEGEDLEAELILFMKSRFHSSGRDKKFFRLAISRAMIDPKSREDVQKYASMKQPALVERFRRLQKKGKLRAGVDLDRLIDVLHSIAFSVVILLDGIECLEMDEADKMVTAAANMLANGLKP